MIAVCNAGLWPAELDLKSCSRPARRQRYKAFWDSLTGSAEEEIKQADRNHMQHKIYDMIGKWIVPPDPEIQRECHVQDRPESLVQ